MGGEGFCSSSFRLQGSTFIEEETSGGVMVLMIVCIEDDNIMTLNYITSTFFSSHGLAAGSATTTSSL